jgi:hypothetical protein
MGEWALWSDGTYGSNGTNENGTHWSHESHRSHPFPEALTYPYAKRRHPAPPFAASPIRPVAVSPLRLHQLPSAANFSRIAMIKKLSWLRTTCARK